jgi:flavin-dependent dehydrogenase
VIATGAPAMTTMSLDHGDFPLVGTDLTSDGAPFACGPRRSALDRVLVEAAVDAGAELRAGFSVEALTTEGGRVTGIRGGDRRAGTTATEKATIVVGADGRNSYVARAVRATEHEQVPSLTCWYFSYWSDVDGDALEVYDRHGRAVFAFPTNDRLFAVFVAWPAEELKLVRSDIERQFLAAVDGAPFLGERVRAGKRADRFYGATDLRNFLRKPYGPGWALVGDAGCHKDPYLALGVGDAFRDAELVASAIDDGLGGRHRMEDALAEYERRRNEATMPDYRMNLSGARFTPMSADERALRAALHGNTAATREFFLAIEGLVPREPFFARENIGRLVAESPRSGVHA